MRPNTPHCVFTPEAAICHGGHFYATSTIRPTIFGFYHGFAASSIVTNTHHTRDARLLLSRLVTYIHHVLVCSGFSPLTDSTPPVHVPDITTFEGAVDLFMLCIIMELGSLLNPAAYSRMKRVDHKDLLATIRARGLARNLIDWWQYHYVFIGKDGPGPSGTQFFEALFAHHVHGLITYKRLAEDQTIDADDDNCTADQLERWVFLFHQSQLKNASTLTTEKTMTFDWPGEKYRVQRSEQSQPYVQSKLLFLISRQRNWSKLI